MEWQAEPGRRRDPRGWTRSWRAALLAASIFSSSFLLAQGQLASTTNYNISISKNPPETLEGQNVNLTLQHEAASFVTCNWYRGIEMKENLIVTFYLPPISANTTGNSYTGREVSGFGCSLLIKNLNLNDTGTYTVIMNGPSVHGTGLVNIQVLEAINHISISDPGKIVENSTTYLNCTASGFNVSYVWLKGNQKLEAGGHITLSSDGQNLSLSRTSRQDSGLYTCRAINSFSEDATNYTLNVFYGPDAPVISPSGQFYAEGSNLTLSCQADSNPPANYTWSFKNATHSGGIYRLFRLSSANNGTYTCEASNNETKLFQSKAQPVCVLASSPSPTSLLGMLTGVLSPNDPT